MPPRLWNRNKRSHHLSRQSSVVDLDDATSVRSCQRASTSDVLVVGAGPAGLMLADNLARFGIKVDIIDNSERRTLTGRADGLQPKTIETLRQMRLIDSLLRKGVKVYDISFWSSTLDGKMRRLGRKIHYPADEVDVLDPYLLLHHQGELEKLLTDDLKERGVEIRRNTAFMDYTYSGNSIDVTCKAGDQHQRSTATTSFVVGCDGAHSAVRNAIPGAKLIGTSSDSIWGIVDGRVETNFPDLWSKVVVGSEEAGCVMLMPRERNMTRAYIEVKPDSRASTSREELSQEVVMQRAQEILHPFYLKWKTVEWFGRYQVGQRVSTKFRDDNGRVFICGDASHTHSPKAAQGMNTSLHDSYNLAWKLNLAARHLALPSLLTTYETERRAVAHDLVRFDESHASTFTTGNWHDLAANFTTHIRFIAGLVDYAPDNILTKLSPAMGHGAVRPGALLPPARATRLADANPIHLQLDMPVLGQFRIYLLCASPRASHPFLDRFTTACTPSSRNAASFLSRISAAANASSTLQPPLASAADAFVCPARYTPLSPLFTYALLTSAPRSSFALADLPRGLRESVWTLYLDDVGDRPGLATEKWVGALGEGEVAVVVVRPDGYVGTVRVWAEGEGAEAVGWVDGYLEGFLTDVVGATN